MTIRTVKSMEYATRQDSATQPKLLEAAELASWQGLLSRIDSPGLSLRIEGVNEAKMCLLWKSIDPMMFQISPLPFLIL